MTTDHSFGSGQASARQVLPVAPASPVVPARAPLWLEEVVTTLCVHAQVLLTGNIRDRFLLPDSIDRTGLVDVVDALWWGFRPLGWQALVVYDPVHGARVVPEGDAAARVAVERVVDPNRLGRPLPLRELGELLQTVVHARDARLGVVLDYASRLTQDVQNLSEAEHRFFTTCEKLARQAPPLFVHGAGRLFNPVVWLLDGERDVPTFLAARNEAVRTVVVPEPDLGDRLRAARRLGRSFPAESNHPAVDHAAVHHPGAVRSGVDHSGGNHSGTHHAGVSHAAVAPPDGSRSDDRARSGIEPDEELVRRFAAAADGLTLRAMQDVTSVAVQLGFTLRNVDDAVRFYRVGAVENPWARAEVRAAIADPAVITDRVRGQDDAVRHALDIIKRSATGLTNAFSSGTGNRPRGVLFLAGPTGVGKTELAKSLTELVFGTEQAYIRFDMSEFSAEHSQARLIGAPPGYVGFHAGGELTNAVRRQPFSLVLFDEIEKAHPSLLDKFLQILDDGRLTDATGDTVHFTETLIVFTSNLGSTRLHGPSTDGVGAGHGAALRPDVPLPEAGVPPVTADLPFAVIRERITEAIRDHFTHRLGRPELLNRLGENIVVFDFIRPPVARQIAEQQLGRVARHLAAEHGVHLAYESNTWEQLLTLATDDLRHGGRGIRNQLETMLVNPLARHLFAVAPPSGTTVWIRAVVPVPGVNRWEVVLA